MQYLNVLNPCFYIPYSSCSLHRVLSDNLDIWLLNIVSKSTHAFIVKLLAKISSANLQSIQILFRRWSFYPCFLTFLAQFSTYIKTNRCPINLFTISTVSSRHAQLMSVTCYLGALHIQTGKI